MGVVEEVELRTKPGNPLVYSSEKAVAKATSSEPILYFDSHSGDKNGCIKIFAIPDTVSRLQSVCFHLVNPFGTEERKRDHFLIL